MPDVPPQSPPNPPKRGLLGLIANAAREIAGGIDLAAGGETELGKRIRSGADKASSIDDSLRTAREQYASSATKLAVDEIAVRAAERRKRNLEKSGARSSVLRPRKQETR